MIEIKNLTKYFWNNKILNNLNFDIQEGKITGFIGDNGAWKSTTMKILATSLTDYEGNVNICGKNLQENIYDLREIIWFMPDQYGLYQDLSVCEYLEFFLQAYEIPVNHDFIDETLTLVHLEDKKDTPMKGLSRGMTQRVLLAKALITQPKFLILDEPASWLDPKLRLVLKNILQNLKENWVTIFVSSHILSELEAMVDNIVIIDNWEILYSGCIQEFQKSWNKQEIFIHSQDNKKLIWLFNWYEILELEKWILIKNSKNSQEILQTILDNNIEVLEFKNSVQDIETAYISLTNQKWKTQ